MHNFIVFSIVFYMFPAKVLKNFKECNEIDTKVTKTVENPITCYKMMPKPLKISENTIKYNQKHWKYNKIL